MNGRAVAKPVEIGNMNVDAQVVPTALTGKTEMHHVLKIITKQHYIKTMFLLIVKKVKTV